METPLELAEGLQHSNVPEVAQLAKALIALHKDYVRVCAEVIMIRHEKVFKKLAESGD